MTTIAQSSPSQPEPKHLIKPRNIFRRKDPFKKSIGNFTPNVKFRIKLPFTNEKLETQRVYLQKCKTEAIERTLQDDKYLLSDGSYNEFMSNDEIVVSALSMNKIKRQLNTLDRIEKRMSKQAQEILQKPNDSKSHQKIISLLPPLNPKPKEITPGSPSKRYMNELKVCESFDGLVTFSPYKNSISKRSD